MASSSPMSTNSSSVRGTTGWSRNRRRQVGSAFGARRAWSGVMAVTAGVLRISTRPPTMTTTTRMTPDDLVL